jgi:hypothetical protein
MIRFNLQSVIRAFAFFSVSRLPTSNAPIEALSQKG